MFQGVFLGLLQISQKGSGSQLGRGIILQSQGLNMAYPKVGGKESYAFRFLEIPGRQSGKDSGKPQGIKVQAPHQKGLIANDFSRGEAHQLICQRLFAVQLRYEKGAGAHVRNGQAIALVLRH